MSKVVVPSYKQRVVFSQKGPEPQVLQEDELFKVVLAGLEPGQRIPLHPEGGSVYTILEGTGWMTVDAERFPVEAGAVVTMGDGAARGFEANTRLIFLGVRRTAA